jgi:hypothetical protein
VTQRVFRIADEILKALNVMDDAAEKDPNSEEGINFTINLEQIMLLI